jgi:hypothetical protein
VQNKAQGFAACRRGVSGLKTQRTMMPVRLRKFIGTILIVVLVLVYALFAATVAGRVLATASWWLDLIYFLLSGLVWVLPAMLIIKWMAGPPAER